MAKTGDAGKSLKKELVNLTTAGKKLGQEIVDTGGGVEKISQGFTIAAKSASKLTLASKAATLGMKGLAMAGNMIAGIGIGLAINAMITVVSKLVTAQQDAIDKANELTDTYKSCSAEITGNISSLEKMDDELTRLAKGVDENGKNVSLTADEYARYRDIISEVVDMNPSLIKGYNDEGQELVNNNTLIQEAIILQRELNRLKMEEYLSSGKDILKGSKNEKGQAKQEITSIITGSLGNAPLLDNLTGGREWFGTAKTNQVKATLEQFGISLNDILLGNIDSLEILAQKRREIISSLEQEGILDKTKAQELNTQIGLIDIQLNKMDAASQKTSKYLSFWAANDEGNKSWYNEIDTGYLDDFSTSLNTIASNGNMSIAEMQVKVMELGESFAGMQDQIPTQAFEDLQAQLANGVIGEEEYYTALTSLLEQLDKLKEAYPELADAINSVGAAWRGSIGSADVSQAPNFSAIIDPAIESFKNLNTQLDSIQSAYKTFTSAIDEYNQTGTLSLDTTQAILALGDEYIGYLFDENNQLQLNKEGFIALANAKLDKLEADALAAAIDNVRGLTDEATATEYLKGKTQEATEATEQNTIAELENLAVKKAAEGGNLKLATEQITATFNQYKSVIDATRAGLGSYTDATMGATSATKELEEAQKKAEDSLRAQGEAGIRVIDRKIKSIQDAQKASEKAIDSQIDGIKEEKEAYEKAIDAEIDKLNERKQALEDSIKKSEDAASVVVDLIQEQMDAIDKQKDEVNEFYDEQLDALEKVNKELQDQIDRENALEDLQKAKSQRLIVYRKGEGFVEAENEGAVKGAQDNYDQVLADQALQAEKDRLEEERDAKLEALDAEKKLLEEYQKLWGDATSKYEEEMRRKHALEMLGQGYEQAILEQRTDILDKFTQFHYDQTVELEENVLTQIETLTKQKEEAILFEERIAALEEQKAREAENYAARIEDLNGYKEQVQEGLNLIGKSWEEYQDTLKYEAKWEAALLDGMAEKAWEYAESVKAAIRSAQEAIENGNTSSGSGKSSGSSKSPSNDNYDYRTDSSLTAGQKKQAALMEKEFGGKAAGGTVHKTGVYNVDELGDELIVPPPKNGKFKLLEMGTKVFGAAMSQQMMKSFNDQSDTLATDHFSTPMKALNMSVFGAPQGAGQVTHIDVHNLSLPNVRTGDDAQKLIRALIDLGRESYQLNRDGDKLY